MSGTEERSRTINEKKSKKSSPQDKVKTKRAKPPHVDEDDELVEDNEEEIEPVKEVKLPRKTDRKGKPKAKAPISRSSPFSSDGTKMRYSLLEGEVRNHSSSFYA
jgi:hypothetical protein